MNSSDPMWRMHLLSCLLCVSCSAAFVAAEPKRLTEDGTAKYDPVFIEKGESIVYTVQETPTQLSLMKRKLGESKATRLHPEATTAEFAVAFSPDELTYAYLQSRGNLNLKLVIRDVKQAKDFVFDPGAGFASLRRPTVAPDGSRIVFSLPAASGSELVSVTREGKDKRTLVSSGLNTWPSFSPDGKQLVFSSSREGDFDLYTCQADGTNVKRLHKSTGLDCRPSWSPDGKRIVFTSNRDGNYELYLIRADGTGLKRLTENPERDDYPSWHPNGKSIVYVSERKGKFDLWQLEIGE